MKPSIKRCKTCGYETFRLTDDGTEQHRGCGGQLEVIAETKNDDYSWRNSLHAFRDMLLLPFEGFINKVK